MKQIRVRKPQHSARLWLDPLPPDAGDPDIVRAKQLARWAGRPSPDGRAHERDRLPGPQKPNSAATASRMT